MPMYLSTIFRRTTLIEQIGTYNQPNTFLKHANYSCKGKILTYYNRLTLWFSKIGYLFCFV